MGRKLTVRGLEKRIAKQTKIVVEKLDYYYRYNDNPILFAYDNGIMRLLEKQIDCVHKHFEARKLKFSFDSNRDKIIISFTAIGSNRSILKQYDTYTKECVSFTPNRHSGLIVTIFDL